MLLVAVSNIRVQYFHFGRLVININSFVKLSLKYLAFIFIVYLLYQTELKANVCVYVKTLSFFSSHIEFRDYRFSEDMYIEIYGSKIHLLQQKLALGI